MRIGDIVGREVDIDYTSHNVPFTTLDILVIDEYVLMPISTLQIQICLSYTNRAPYIHSSH